jgi:ribosomal protein S18 acetylase RimI-like enzyme
MNFFDKTGKMAIGSRLRIFTDALTADAAKVYAAYGLDFKPKWFPIIFLLSDGEPRSITGIAKEIGHSHPSVSNITKELIKVGWVCEVADKSDRRKNLITLSTVGKDVAVHLDDVCKDVSSAVETLSDQSCHDLWKALADWEDLLAERSLTLRVADARKQRESNQTEIVPYEDKYHSAFYKLNEQWITEHWKLEDADRYYMDNPQEHIIDKGGIILVACYKGEPVGVCALLKMHDDKYDFELAKLAVSPSVRGLGIGDKLCNAIVDAARAAGAKHLFLESNRILRPAIILYKKLGFKELPEYHPAYARGDIQMELKL